MKKCFTADFETTTKAEDCRVWAWAICNIDYPEDFRYGNSMEGFMELCEDSGTNYEFYFHNLKFDGGFIISWLLHNGFEHVRDVKERKDNTFTTLITDMGQFYQITVYFKVTKHYCNKVTFKDSLKIFPNFSVERVAQGFNLPIGKLELDYETEREVGHKLTEHEIAYIRNDVEIMARALNIMFDNNLTKMTIAGDAMSSFKDFQPDWRKIFPKLPLDIDAEIRTAYRGGFTYVNDKYTEKPVGSGIVLDVNSLYPAMMLKELPYGKPEFFEGKYQDDLAYPLYIQQLTCDFQIKPDKIPTIQLHNNLSFMPNEYIKSSKNKRVTLNLTKPDLELFFEHYDVDVYEWNGGWKFKKRKGVFDDYINYWTEQKIKAAKEGNAPQRQIAKLMLNSLYGRTGLNPKSRQKYPVLDHDGIVRYVLGEPEEREPVYIPVACFITAYGRCNTIRASQMIREWSEKKYGVDKYLYSDTDSIHANLTVEDLEELKEVMDIDDYKLGYWSFESEFDRALFIRQKCYVEEKDGKLNVTVAGLPKYLTPIINFETFKKGFTTEGLTREDLIRIAKENGASEEQIKKLHPKLTYKYVKGGVILADTDFTIK